MKEVKKEEKETNVKINEEDLKALRDLEKLIKKYNNPFWKIVFIIIAINSILMLLYEIGYAIGKFLA